MNHLVSSRQFSKYFTCNNSFHPDNHLSRWQHSYACFPVEKLKRLSNCAKAIKFDSHISGQASLPLWPMLSPGNSPWFTRMSLNAHTFNVTVASCSHFHARTATQPLLYTSFQISKLGEYHPGMSYYHSN